MEPDTRLSVLAAATALPVVLFATVVLFLYGSERSSVVEQTLRVQAGSAASAVERQVASEFGVLNALAVSEALDRPDLPAFQALARRIVESRPSWFAITLSERGQPVMSTRVPPPPAVDRDSLERVFATGRPQVGGMERNAEEEAVFPARVPVVRDGEVRFTLTALIRAKPLETLLREQELPADRRIGVFDRNGRLVAGSPPDPRPGGGAAADRAAAGREAVVRSDLTGWTVVAGRRTDDPAWTTTHRPVILAALGGLLAVGCAGVLAAGRMRALRRQREAARLMAELETERAVASRLTDIAAHFPGIIYRRVLKDGVVAYPYVSDYRHILGDGGTAPAGLDGEGFARAITARMTPASRQRWTEAIRRSAETGEPYACELEITASDDRRLVLRSLAHTRRTADGAVLWDGLILDVTAEREAEARSRLSDERLRQAVEAADLGTFELDLASRRLIWSPRCKAMFGLPPEAEVTGGVFLSRVHPDDQALVRAAEAEALAPDGRGEYRVRFRALWPDGTMRWLEAQGRMLARGEGAEARPARLIGTVMDVTEARRAERAVAEARDRAEEASRSKSRFLAAASHDLRQPLQAMFLFAEALHPHVGDPAGREKLMHLERGMDALKGLLDGLLETSRLDAGLVEPVVGDVPLAPLLEEVAAAYGPVARGKGLALEIDGRNRAAGVVVRSDRRLLFRMLGNIVENAIRYTAAGGIRIGCVGTAGDGRVHVEIADSGIGIPADHLERIWDEFHQVGNPERDRQRGLGLGLAIVRRIADLLDHPVTVRSAPGRGSVFGVALQAGTPVAPAAPPPAATAVPAEAEAKAESAGFAVVVDDDAIVLLGLKAMFEEWGYDVLVAGSTADAVAQLKACGRRPDILVVDYRLRDGRVGTEAVAAVRALFGAPIPGILLTGEMVADCRQDAAAHDLRVIHKPVTPRQLRQALQGQAVPAE